MNLTKVIIKPLISEKTVAAGSTSSPQYTFLVNKLATKNEIRESLKKILDVDVVSIQTLIISRKIKRSIQKSRVQYKTQALKKAIVTLKTGQKLDFINKKSS
ncbi:MAG: 50S ribosomal protein L23 [candidate division WWE3 bacterium]|nr:50S ribosomal protein L23 [candidate division WWE3 bacterium]